VIDKGTEESVEQKDKDISLYGAIAKDLGKSFAPGSIVLDFGCGEGQLVLRLRERGFEAYGTDVLLNERNETLRLIRSYTKYRFPFPDQMFDAVISCSVLEHVNNLSQVIAEMHRVLKPSGFCLHFFHRNFERSKAIHSCRLPGTSKLQVVAFLVTNRSTELFREEPNIFGKCST
jgi:ubiquinone/menaquinone biosynthesis C-methylase UbiE